MSTYWFHVLQPLCLPGTHNLHHILIGHRVSQANSLRNVLRARAPDQRVLERLLHGPVDGVAHVLNRAVPPDDQGLVEIRLDSLPLGVYADQPEILPAAVDHVVDAQVHLAGHDDRIGLSRQLVQEVEADGVDLVVHVQALDVLPVVLHDHVDEVVDRRVLVAHEDFAVEHLVVAEDVVQHLLIEVLRGRLERDLHSAGFLGLEVDVRRLAV